MTATANVTIGAVATGHAAPAQAAAQPTAPAQKTLPRRHTVAGAMVFSIGKHGILWKLDRASGAFLDYKETIFQNIFKALDRKTGRVTYLDDIANVKLDEMLSVCPGYSGGHA